VRNSSYKIALAIVLIYFSLVACEKNNTSTHTKSQWITDFITEIKSGNYPKIYGISWWHENFDSTFFTINSSVESQNTYRKMVDDDIFITSCSFENKKLIPVQGKIYHSAFPFFGGTEDKVSSAKINDFEYLANKKIAWAYFSNNWLDSLVFPSNSISIITSNGKTPFLRMMYRSEFEENHEDPKYKMIDIVNGKYDSWLKKWAKEAKNTNINLLAEFGTEVNGKWFSWNGYYSGAGVKDKYGDKEYPDGPEIFRDAYRYIIDICKQQGVDNITWFFHLDVNDDPEQWWNSPEYYYPGDDYIDWIGVSIYGPYTPDEDYIEPKVLISKAYKKMETISGNKPFAVLEFGVTEL